MRPLLTTALLMTPVWEVRPLLLRLWVVFLLVVVGMQCHLGHYCCWRSLHLPQRRCPPFRSPRRRQMMGALASILRSRGRRRQQLLVVLWLLLCLLLLLLILRSRLQRPRGQQRPPRRPTRRRYPAVDTTCSECRKGCRVAGSLAARATRSRWRLPPSTPHLAHTYTFCWAPSVAHMPSTATTVHGRSDSSNNPPSPPPITTNVPTPTSARTTTATATATAT